MFQSLLGQAQGPGVTWYHLPSGRPYISCFLDEDFPMVLCRTPLETHLKLTCKSEGVYALWVNDLFPVDNSEVHQKVVVNLGPSYSQSSSSIYLYRISSFIVLSHPFSTLFFICFPNYVPCMQTLVSGSVT